MRRGRTAFGGQEAGGGPHVVGFAGNQADQRLPDVGNCAIETLLEVAPDCLEHVTGTRIVVDELDTGRTARIGTDDIDVVVTLLEIVIALKNTFLG